MTKIALIADTHFGVRNDSEFFIAYQKWYYAEKVLPYLIENQITKLFHLGDFFDRRKYINFKTLVHSKRNFLYPILEAGIEIHQLVGNHDSYYKNTHEVVSVRELFYEMQELHDNFFMYDQIDEIEVYGKHFLMCPWVNPENEKDFKQVVDVATAEICCGHFEIVGMQMCKIRPYLFRTLPQAIKE